MHDRDRLGRLVRAVWVEWAKQQPAPKPSWLLPWEELSEPDREADRRIGARLWCEGFDYAIAGNPPTPPPATELPMYVVKARALRAAIASVQEAKLYRAEVTAPGCGDNESRFGADASVEYRTDALLSVAANVADWIDQLPRLLTSSDERVGTVAGASAAGEKTGALSEAEAIGNQLSFAQLRAANVARCEAVFHPLADWAPIEWAAAVAGEVGEACNLIKKQRRGDSINVADIGDELADVVIYLDLLAARLDLDLGGCTVRKFNAKSDEFKAPQRLRDTVVAKVAWVSDEYAAAVAAKQAPPPAPELPEAVAWRWTDRYDRSTMYSEYKPTHVETEPLYSAATVRSQQSTIDRLQDEIERIGLYEVAEWMNRLEAMTAEVERLRKQEAHWRDCWAKAQVELDTRPLVPIAEHNELKRDCEDAEKRCAEAKDKLTVAQGTITGMQRDRDAERATLARVTKERDEARAIGERLLDEKAAVVADVERLTKELADVQASVCALQAELQAERERCSGWRKIALSEPLRVREYIEESERLTKERDDLKALVAAGVRFVEGDESREAALKADVERLTAENVRLSAIVANQELAVMEATDWKRRAQAAEKTIAERDATDFDEIQRKLKELASEPEPTIGRIVHYCYAEGPAGTKYRPAIILEVYPNEDDLLLQVFPAGAPPHQCSAHKQLPGRHLISSWRWPPRS